MGLFKNIKEGWGNYLTYFYNNDLSPDILDIAEKRANICKECTSLKESKVMSIITTVMPNGHKHKSLAKFMPESDSDKIQGYECSECGCGFPAMVFSPGKKCPLNKW
jgi:hypothetical protein